jgi:glycosyltransferase involved in cell wall biosynthesis
MKRTKHEGTVDHSRPFRIGIWCDYGRTLTPTEGIGVFAHNLAAGLIELEEPVDVVLLTHAQERHVVEYLRQRAPDRVRVIPDVAQVPQFRLGLGGFLRGWSAGRTAIAALVNQVSSWRDARIAAVKSRLLGMARAAFHRSVLGFFGTGLALAILALSLWPPWAVATVSTALVRAAIFPLLLLDWVVEQVAFHPRFSTWPANTDVARDAQCDIWIIPYVGHEYPLDFPAVIFVHDMVIAHYPECFPPQFVARLNVIVRERVREAIFCCCMSEFIRNNDLLGVLRLPETRVKMVPAAAPRDFPNVSPEAASRLLPSVLQRPYLFYPAAFRPYKNHRGLIEALRYLCDERGEDGFDLVFTGAAAPFPVELTALVERHGLRGRVHVLGRVSREVLAALYQSAFATVVPSRYEQGSFPIHEAIHWGCPAACSDIPPLREQCAALGDAMVYFDPTSPMSIADAVLRLRDGREAIRGEQHRRSLAQAARTWKQVAEEWLPILREAAEIGRSRGQGKDASVAA